MNNSQKPSGTSAKKWFRHFWASLLWPVPIIVTYLLRHLGDDLENQLITLGWMLCGFFPFIIFWVFSLTRIQVRQNFGLLTIYLCGVLPAVVLGVLTILAIGVIEALRKN